MNVRTLIKRTATATGFAAMVVFTSACAHHNSSTTADNDFGHVGQDGATTQVSSTSPTPIPGPAKVDDTGRVYTSSAAGGTGNAENVGTNTNVNIVPGTVKSTSDVTYTETAAAPPAPVVVETPAPVVTTPTVTETTTTTTEAAPMTSSVTEQTTTTDTTTTTEKTTTKHRRMRKD